MDSGELCVMTYLELLKLTVCADNWDTTQLIATITSLRENNNFLLQDMSVYALNCCLFDTVVVTPVNPSGWMMLTAFLHKLA